MLAGVSGVVGSVRRGCSRVLERVGIYNTARAALTQFPLKFSGHWRLPEGVYRLSKSVDGVCRSGKLGALMALYVSGARKRNGESDDNHIRRLTSKQRRVWNAHCQLKDIRDLLQPVYRVCLAVHLLLNGRWRSDRWRIFNFTDYFCPTVLLVASSGQLCNYLNDKQIITYDDLGLDSYKAKKIVKGVGTFGAGVAGSFSFMCVAWGLARSFDYRRGGLLAEASKLTINARTDAFAGLKYSCDFAKGLSGACLGSGTAHHVIGEVASWGGSIFGVAQFFSGDIPEWRAGGEDPRAAAAAA